MAAARGPRVAPDALRVDHPKFVLDLGSGGTAGEDIAAPSGERLAVAQPPRLRCVR
jgi:hypothetical protein